MKFPFVSLVGCWILATGCSSSDNPNPTANTSASLSSASLSSGSLSSLSTSSSTRSSSAGQNYNKIELGKRLVSEQFSLTEVLAKAAINLQAKPSLAKASAGVTAFESTDEHIATIDENGWVTVLGAGEASLKAYYDDGSVDELDLKSIKPDFRFYAWVGPDDTEITFNQGVEGITLTRSRDETCDIENFYACSFGQSGTVGVEALVDTAANLTTPGFYHFDFGNNQTSSAILGAVTFSERNHPTILTFQEKLWVVGGRQGVTYLNDIWSSHDGNTWTRMKANAAFGPRMDHAMHEYRGRLYLVGGVDNDIRYASNDVWSSDDGITWQLETAAAPFAARRNALMYVANDWLYVANGTDAVGRPHNDLWKTQDGKNWIQVNAEVAFPGAYGGRDVTFFDGKWWAIAEIKEENLARRIALWQSLDGENWTLALDNFNFGYHPYCQYISQEDALWMFCYSYNKGHGYIWQSSDGVNWTKLIGGVFWGNLVPFPGEIRLFKDQIFLIGGSKAIFKGRNDVYSSTDGLNWKDHGAGGFYASRAGHRITDFDGELISIGGFNRYAHHKTIWSSADGLAWEQINAAAEFRSRAGHAQLTFDNKLWVIGGHGQIGGISFGNGDGDIITQTFVIKHYADVWSSADGVSWAKSPEPPFSAREYASAAVFNDKLWLVSGGVPVDGVIPSDIWMSEDGEAWTEVTANAPFAGRKGHALTVFNGRLYLSGGADAEGYLMHDVWSTADGISWQQELNERQFMDRAYHQMVAFDNALWIVGGQTYNYDTQINFEPVLVESADVWRSVDGSHWTQVIEKAPFDVRSHHQLLVKDNKLWVFGGMGRDGSFEGSVSEKPIRIDPYYYQEVWSSSDGVDWRQGFSQQLKLFTDE